MRVDKYQDMGLIQLNVARNPRECLGMIIGKKTAQAVFSKDHLTQ